jgi:hypothetical protein
MIEARRVSIWNRRYAITADGREVATWERAGSTTGGTLQWDGRRYQVQASMMGGPAIMSAPGGRPVATAHDVGRRHWTIHADGETYDFRRAPAWRLEEKLHVQGHRVGSVRRTNILRGDVVADLPGMPLPVQLFALSLVLTMWDATAAW